MLISGENCNCNAKPRQSNAAVGTRNGQLADRTVHALGRDVPELGDTSPRRDLGWRVDRVVERTVRPPLENGQSAAHIRVMEKTTVLALVVTIIVLVAVYLLMSRKRS